MNKMGSETTALILLAILFPSFKGVNCRWTQQTSPIGKKKETQNIASWAAHIITSGVAEKATPSSTERRFGESTVLSRRWALGGCEPVMDGRLLYCGPCPMDAVWGAAEGRPTATQHLCSIAITVPCRSRSRSTFKRQISH